MCVCHAHVCNYVSTCGAVPIEGVGSISDSSGADPSVLVSGVGSSQYTNEAGGGGFRGGRGVGGGNVGGGGGDVGGGAGVKSESVFRSGGKDRCPILLACTL